MFALCFLVNVLVYSQDKKPEAPFVHVVKFNPVQFLFSTMTLSYEYRPDVSKSFNFSIGVTYRDRVQENYYTEKDYVEGLAGECQVRLFPLAQEQTEKNFFNNFYVSPYFQYKNFYIKDYSFNNTMPQEDNINDFYVQSSDRFNVYSMGIITGINNIINKRFHIDFYFGGGIRLSDTKKFNDNIFDYGYKGIVPRIGVDIGINF